MEISRPDKGKEKVLLNAATPLFAELRDQTFSSIGRRLNELAKRLTTEAQSRQKSKNVQELKLYMNRVGGIVHEQQGLETRIAFSPCIE